MINILLTAVSTHLQLMLMIFGMAMMMMMMMMMKMMMMMLMMMMMMAMMMMMTMMMMMKRFSHRKELRHDGVVGDKGGEGGVLLQETLSIFTNDYHNCHKFKFTLIL